MNSRRQLFQRLSANPVTDAKEPEPKEPDRRKALAVAAAAGIGGLLLLKPKEAKADLNYVELVAGLAPLLSAMQAVQGFAGQIRDILSAAITLVVSLSVPSSFMELIRCLGGFGLGLRFNFNACGFIRDIVNGEYSMQRTERIPQTMEDIWGFGPATVPIDMDDAIVERYTAMRQQVEAASLVTAGLTEGQDILGEEDAHVLDQLNAAAAVGSIISVLALHARLTFGTNMRLSQIIQALNAQQSTAGSHMLADHHADFLDAETRRRMREPTLIPIPGAQTIGPGAGGGLTTLSPGG